MDAYVVFLAAMLAGVDAVKADRLKRIQKNIRMPFSFTPMAEHLLNPNPRPRTPDI
jgi:hypothetical protein